MTNRCAHIYPEAMNRLADTLGSWRSKWRTAGHYGIRRDLIKTAWSGFWERFWLCRVRGQHHEKMFSHGLCYRCGKAMR